MFRGFVFLICLWLATPAFALVNSPSLDLRDKRALLLYSYHPSFPTSSRVLTGIQSVFEDKGPVIDIEYMDSKRLYDRKSRENFLTSLQYKISHRDPYDVVIAIDDHALDFMRQNGTALFPGVPTVFLGVNDLEKAKQQDRVPYITGIVEAASFRETLELIGEIQPQRTRLSVIVDGTTSGQADLQALLGVSNYFTGTNIEILSLEALSWSEYKTQLEALGDEDVLLLLSAFRDRHGKVKSFAESLDLLNAVVKVPVYHLWAHGVGQGLVGGVVVSHHEQGRRAALMVERILGGTPVAEIPVLTQSPNLTMLDYWQLRRFRISQSVLPQNSVVMSKPDPIWVAYRNEILFIGGLLFVLTTSSIYLLRQNVALGRVSRELYEKSNFARRLMNTIPDLVWMKNTKGVYLTCNQRFEQFFGASEAEIVGQSDFDFVDQELADHFRKHDRLALINKQPSLNEEKVTFASDGHEELLETVKIPVIAANGDVLGVLGVSRDITSRRAAEEKIRIMSQAVEQSPVSAMITDVAGKIEYVNQSFEKHTGFDREEVIGRSPQDLCLGRTPADTYVALWEGLSKGEKWEGEFLNRKKNGEVFWEYAHIAPVLVENGSVRGYLVLSEDITVRKQQQEKILYQAQFDALTGLPNRVLSLDRLQQLLFLAKRQSQRAAVLFIDLDDFKKVNDSLGHHVGDEFLVQVAQRLRREIRELDTVGRFGGDEFLVLLSGLAQAEDAGKVANQLIQALEAPFNIAGRELLVTASVGISIYPEDGDRPQDLLRKADTAMYSAKRGGRGSHAYFTKELNADISRRFILEEQLHGALEREEFYMVYQPQVDVTSGELVGMEALLRWKNEALGEVSPVEFIPVAEQTGAIIPIGRFVIETALQEAQQWLKDASRSLTLAINLSPRQFRDGALNDFILSRLQAVSVAPTSLELEITEGLFIEEHSGVAAALEKLHDEGIRLAIDDFGTGYSSLSCLRRYPFDTLKIDREFTQGITEDEADYELVFALISMAHGLGLNVVAEGVESVEQHKLLKYHACDVAQGYYFSVPVLADAMTDLIEGELVSS